MHCAVTSLAEWRRRTLKLMRAADEPVSRAALKGLRHFSMKVCQKVESKGRTTYNEVADELVRDFSTLETSAAPRTSSC